MKSYIILATALVLSGCATGANGKNGQKDASMGENMGSVTSSALEQTQDGLTDAVLSPLEDLNLRRNEIPDLIAGIKSPYDVPYEMSCDEVAARVSALNTILGRDWDHQLTDERLRSEILAEQGAEATLGMVASEARGLIPFRGVVRFATGADKHSKAYAKAFVIGAQRRSYLKGYGLARNCPFPARPDFSVNAESSPDNVVFKGDEPANATAVPRSEPTITRRVTRTYVRPGGTTSSEPTAPTE